MLIKSQIYLIFSLQIALCFSTRNSTDYRIVGGAEVANPGKYPWMAQIRLDGIFHCGGVLIDSTRVLTAAHCIKDDPNVKMVVTLGAHELYDPNAQIYEIANTVKHSDYGTQGVSHDLAYFVLKKAVEDVDPIKVQKKKVETDKALDDMAWVIGWGSTAAARNLASALKELKVPLVSDADCQTAFSQSAITSSMICAGKRTGGEDACQGDSGGPLFTLDDNKNAKLIGIVSWGEGCARKNKFGVYARVSEDFDFIFPDGDPSEDKGGDPGTDETGTGGDPDADWNCTGGDPNPGTDGQGTGSDTGTGSDPNPGTDGQGTGGDPNPGTDGKGTGGDPNPGTEGQGTGDPGTDGQGTGGDLPDCFPTVPDALSQNT